MHIDSQDTVADQPIFAVRAFLRRNALGFGLADAAAAFGKAASKVVTVLEREGFVELVTDEFESRYHNTAKGGALALASAAKPVNRKTAQKRLEEFLARCSEVNTRDDMLFKVVRVVLFGSMLGEKEFVGDVDLAVTLSPKEPDGKKHVDLCRQQAQEAAKRGRRFSSFLEELDFSRVHVWQFLKGRSRVLQLVGGNDGILKQAAHKVIFGDSE